MYLPLDLQDTSHYLPLLAVSVPLINQFFIPRTPSIEQNRPTLLSRRLDQDLSDFYRVRLAVLNPMNESMG